MTDPIELHALADGELNGGEEKTLREALKTDLRAAAEVDAIRNFKDVLKNNSLRHSDEEVWHGCVARLNAIDRTRKVEGFVGRYAWALCGCLFLFIVSGRFAMRNVEGDAARTADLARIFGPSSAPSKETLQQSKMYSELLSRVRSSLNRSEIELGVPSYGSFHDMPASRVPLRDGEGDLVLFQVGGILNLQDTAPMPTNSAMASGVADGENCLVWHSNGRTWLLSGNRSVDALGEVASRLFDAR